MYVRRCVKDEDGRDGRRDSNEGHTKWGGFGGRGRDGIKGRLVYATQLGIRLYGTVNAYTNWNLFYQYHDGCLREWQSTMFKNDEMGNCSKRKLSPSIFTSIQIFRSIRDASAYAMPCYDVYPIYNVRSSKEAHSLISRPAFATTAYTIWRLCMDVTFPSR